MQLILNNTKNKGKYLVLLSLLVLALLLISYFLLPSVLPVFGVLPEEHAFIFGCILAGFIAQIVDGTLGMAYGVSATSYLLLLGLSPATVSASVHSAEMFTSGVSGFMHLKIGNVNKKLFKTLLIPGMVGAAIGAMMISKVDHWAVYLRPLIACYTFFLGVKIITKALRKNVPKKKTQKVKILAFFGGWLDAIGGGGWGPIVSSTLLANGRDARYTIGSVNLTEFFVTLAGSLVFVVFLGFSHLPVIIALVFGGVLASPLSVRLAGVLPRKTMMLSVGTLVIIISILLIIKFLL